MSIEAQPQLTTTEVNNQIDQMEHAFEQPDRSAIIAGIVEDITTHIVPGSLEKAEQIATNLKAADKIVRGDIRKNPALLSELDEEVVDDLHVTAQKGVDNWRLSRQERSEFAEVTGARNAKQLSLRMKSLMGTISPDEASGTEKLALLKKQARDRLNLDEAIQAKYGAANAKRKALPEVEGDATYDLNVYKNGAKHIYVMGADGKKRHVSADTILAAYGHAGDYQGKRPVDEREIIVTEDTESTPVDVFVRPDDFPAEEWEKLDANGKNIVMVVAAKEAAKNTPEKQDLEMPENFGDDPVQAKKVWDSLSHEQQLLVKKIEADEKAKQAKPALAKPDSVTQEDWDKMDRLQQSIELRVAPEKIAKAAAAKRAEELSMPEGYGNVARWNTFNDEQKRKIKAAIERRTTAKSEAATERVRLDEIKKQPETRKNRIATRIVAAAVAGAFLLDAVIISKLNSFEDESTARAAVAQSQTHAQPVKKATVKPTHAAKVAKESVVRFKRGDTPWSAAETILVHRGIDHPTNAQIDKEADQLRAINGHMSEAKAKKLPVGFKLKIR